MNTIELISAYQKTGHGLPAMNATGFASQSHTIDTPDAALAWFLSQCPQSGWLQLQQKDIAFAHGNLSNIDNPQHGFLIHAEGCIDEKTSISIRYDGKGSYLATVFTLPNGDSHLVDTILLLGTAKASGKSRYLRIWDTQTKCPMMAMFNGFEGI
jgi:hypothetical protein